MSNDKELTERQVQLLDHLPASAGDLTDALDMSRSGVYSLVERTREKGYNVQFDGKRGVYVPPDDDHGDADVKESVDRSELVETLRTEGATYYDIMDDHGVCRQTAQQVMEDLQEAGYRLEFKEVNASGKRLWYIPDDREQEYTAGDGDGVYVFGLISDTHLGSQAEHLDELHDYYDRLVDRGIDTVYHAGDITDGWKVHKGHINVLKGDATGWSRLLDYVTDVYPQRDGVDTFFIEGNHDRKYHRRNGLHLGELIDQRRDDLHYCGDSQARFLFDPDNDVDLELIHPSGGKPYTAGYRLQTLYRERPADERPALAGVGHLHGSMYAKTEGVVGFYTGCWKGLTTYGKRKGHNSEIGGWIVEIEVEDGELRRVNPEWIGYESEDSTATHTPSDLDQMRST